MSHLNFAGLQTLIKMWKGGGHEIEVCSAFYFKSKLIKMGL